MTSCRYDYEEDRRDMGVNIYIIIFKKENELYTELYVIYFIIKSQFLMINNLNKLLLVSFIYHLHQRNN